MSDPFSRTRRVRRAPATARDADQRSLAGAAALGGLLAAGATLAVCVVLALTAWFLADAGAHGDTTDALRAGADAWLMGHGSRLELAGLPLGVLPMALTVGLLVGAFRSGRWATRHGAGTEDDAVLVCVLATESGATPGLGRSVLGALLVAALGGGAGLAAGTGRAGAWVDRTPLWAREVVVGAVVSALALVAAGAALAAVSLVLSFNEAASVYSGLDLGTGDALTFTVVMALAAPNVALLGSAYLLGPGFAFGTGTTITPTAVTLGAVPSFPVLAALPGDGAPPGWLAAVMGVPALCAALGTTRARRYADPVPLDLAALRGAGAGLGAGILVTVLVALAGGPLGTGRLADIGAPVAEVMVFATGTMSVGGLLGCLVQAWWWRRRG
jgi:hypothetical protein